MTVLGLDIWGSWVGIAGLVITGIGAFISYKAFRRAGTARDAATAAEIASKETRAAIIRSLTTVDLERAIGLVQRLKEAHRARRWDICLGYYDSLQVMLTDVLTWYPAPTAEIRNDIEKAIQLIQTMETQVDTAREQATDPVEFGAFNWMLNDIQGLLRDLSISIKSLDQEEEN